MSKESSNLCYLLAFFYYAAYVKLLACPLPQVSQLFEKDYLYFEGAARQQPLTWSISQGLLRDVLGAGCLFINGWLAIPTRLIEFTRVSMFPGGLTIQEYTVHVCLFSQNKKMYP